MISAARVLVTLGSSPDQIRTANQQLLAFFEQKECFQECLQAMITNSLEENLRQFSANTRKHFFQLSEDEAQVFLQEIFRYLSSSLLPLLQPSTSSSSASHPKALVDRVCRILAAAVVRFPPSLPSFLTFCLELVERQAGEGGGGSGLGIGGWLGFELLWQVSEELEEADSSRRGREGMTTLLREALERAIRLADQLLLMSPSPLPTASLSFLRLTAAYVKSGSAAPLYEFQENHRPVLDHLLYHLLLPLPLPVEDTNNSSSTLTLCFSLSHSIYRDLLAQEDYPPNERSQLVKEQLLILSFLQRLENQTFLPFLLSSLNSNTNSNNNNSNDKGVALLTEVVLSLLVIANKQLAQPSSSSSSSTQLLYKHLLSILQLPQCHFLLLTFDFWFEVEYLPLEERGALLEEVLLHLFTTLLSHCQYERSLSISNGNDDEEMEEDFLALRNEELGVKDLFLLCWETNSKGVITSLRQLAGQVCQSSSSLLSSWQGLEALLFCLTCTMSAVKRCLIEGEGLIRQEVLELLFLVSSSAFSLLENLQSPTHSFAGKAFCFTMGKFLVTFTSLIPTDSNSSSFSDQEVQFLRETYCKGLSLCLSLALDINEEEAGEERDGEGLKVVSGRCFQRMVQQGKSFLLTTGLSTLHSSLLFFFSHYQPGRGSESEAAAKHVVEGIASIIFQLEEGEGSQNSEVKSQLVGQLLSPFLSSLQQITSKIATTPSPQTSDLLAASALISLCSSVISSKTSPPSSTDSTHLQLQQFTALVNASLQALFHSSFSSISSSSSASSVTVISAIFSFYGKSVEVVGVDEYPGIEEAIKEILLVFERRSSFSASSSSAYLRIAILTAASFVDGIFNANRLTEEVKDSLLLHLARGVILPLQSIIQEMTGGGGNNLQAEEEIFRNLDFDLFKAGFDFLLLYLRGGWKVKLDQEIIWSILNILSILLYFPMDKNSLQSICNVLQLLMLCNDVEETSQLRSHQNLLPPLLARQLRQLTLPQAHSSALQVLGESLSSTILFFYAILPENEADQALVNAFCQTVLFVERFDADHLPLVMKLLKQFSFNNSRRYKAFLVDIAKICSMECTLDALVAYSEEL